MYTTHKIVSLFVSSAKCRLDLNVSPYIGRYLPICHVKTQTLLQKNIFK